MRASKSSIVVLIGCLLGFVFAAVSTYDFVAHLDRQVHGVHCSFIPGMGSDPTGASGCHTTLMSPYSSVFRQSIWGGIPISLGGMAIFAFIAFVTLALLLSKRGSGKKASLVLLGFSAIPLLTSVVMGYLAIIELDAVCKLCIGIYASSLIVFLGALGVWRGATDSVASDGFVPGEPVPGDPAHDGPEASSDISQATVGGFAVAFLAFMLLPIAAYALAVPSYESFIGACGTLEEPEDKADALVPIGAQGMGAKAIEVFDPLCPACRAFERRFEASSLDEKVSRNVLLFPLDAECNWMVTESVHPGACAVSEAILCAGPQAKAVIDWSFDNQEALLASAKGNPDNVRGRLLTAFPGLKGCLGEAKVQARLNRALRYAVNNQLPIVTPQLYVNGTKLCDEDTDLGMEYMLSRMTTMVGVGGK